MRRKSAVLSLALAAAATVASAAPAPGVYSSVCRRAEAGDLTGAELRIVGPQAVKLFVCDGSCWPIPTAQAQTGPEGLVFQAARETFDISGKHPQRDYQPMTARAAGKALVLAASDLTGPVQTLAPRKVTGEQSPDLDPKSAPRCS